MCQGLVMSVMMFHYMSIVKELLYIALLNYTEHILENTFTITFSATSSLYVALENSGFWSSTSCTVTLISAVAEPGRSGD